MVRRAPVQTRNGLYYYIDRLNSSKFFAGIIMIMLNIGSKYITVKLSKTQEQYLRNSVARQLLIFSIVWMGSRDIVVALVLTCLFILIADHLFNEESPYCILPLHSRRYEELLDLNHDGRVTPEEADTAIRVLQKLKVRKREVYSDPY